MPNNLFPTVKKFLRDSVYMNIVPAYGNTIFYSFGFLIITCLSLLIVSGAIMVAFGPNWWAASQWGIYTRSVHMWSAQALVLFLILHLLVTFSTSAFKTKKFVWLFGSVLLFIIIVQTELGYSIRGDFSSQWRALGGADFWNGSGLGHFVNTLNYGQIFSIHTLIIPLIVIMLGGIHYMIVRTKGLSKPYRGDIEYKMVEANHKVLFLRGGLVAIVILLISFFIRSPFVSPITLESIAVKQPELFKQTLLAEFARTSDTATYEDTIDPYNFDTRDIYVNQPYSKLIAATGGDNMLAALESSDKQSQDAAIEQAQAYFSGQNKVGSGTDSASNPLIIVINSLTSMAQSGIYGPTLRTGLTDSNPTYITRFLADTGAIEQKADKFGLSLEDYGMLKDETGNGIYPPNSWWMAPFNFMDNTILANDPNQDRDGAEAVGLAMILLATFPWIPYVNRIPDKLGLYKLIWRVKR